MKTYEKAYKQGLINYIISDIYIYKDSKIVKVVFKEGIEYEFITQVLLSRCCLTKQKIVKDIYYKHVKSC